jgi:anti-sigma factor RsiW
MRDCVRFAPMIGARPGELSDEEARRLADHLALCEACQARLEDEEALSGMLPQALLEDANRRDFSAFADEVMGRIGASERGAGLFSRLGRWARRHRAAAAFSALAPALAALAVVVYLDRAATPEPMVVEVSAEGRAPILLETSEGPVVLLGGRTEGS